VSTEKGMQKPKIVGYNTPTEVHCRYREPLCVELSVIYPVFQRPAGACIAHFTHLSVRYYLVDIDRLGSRLTNPFCFANNSDQALG
jgi:uncharacterized protein YfaA (DUF2138 family)